MRRAIVAVFVTLLVIGPAVAQDPQPAPAPAAPSAESLAAARDLVQVMKATDQFKVLIPMLMEKLGLTASESAARVIVPSPLAGEGDARRATNSAG